MQPVKVLYLLHDARRSGVPAVAVNFIRLAKKVQVAPTVAFAYDGIYAQELRAEGIPVITLGARTPLVWRAKRFLLNLLLLTRGRSFDVVHAHSLKLAWSVICARALGLPVVFHIHEMPRRIGWLVRQAMLRADEVVFCSQTCAEHFAMVPARRRRTIVNALELAPEPPVRTESGRLRVVMIASLNRNKGQDLLLKAFSLLARNDVELWLYGTTGLSARGYVRDLKRFAERNGLADRVFFPGPTHEVMRVLAEAALLVHTSWSESFGMALVEAQSCGVPVVAHALEGMREVVQDGVTGFLVQPGNVDQLAARIELLLEDPALRRSMGSAGALMVRERFSMAVRAPEYLDLYREVCR